MQNETNKESKEANDDKSSETEVSSIRNLVLRQLNKCCQELGKEMDSGGVKNRIIDGLIVQIVMPNQKEIAINSIETLRILLLPEIEKNETILADKFCDFEKENKNIDEWHEMKIKKINEGFEILPFVLREKYFEERNEKLKTAKDEYENKRLDFYKRVLTSISFLLDHLNYFENEQRG